MGLFSSLKREQKEAVGLLQVGTFLEYFDLMLYVHMAVLLDELFFPKTDAQTASILAAFAFCSTFVMRPFGALLFGYIGDHVGRKATIIMTTVMMAISCLVMANLPTYSQIGITAAWIVTICRITQGLASMGEVIGANLYLTEITTPPNRYPIVATLAIAASLGPFVALAVASLVTSSELDWRYAFWIGAIIAVVGATARTRLRETPEFVDKQKKLKADLEKANVVETEKVIKNLKFRSPFLQERTSFKTFFAYFLVLSGWPACFYLAYMHSASILKTQFGMTGEQVIQQNFKVSLFHLSSFTLGAFLVRWVHPMLVLKVRAYIFYMLILVYPFALNYVSSPTELLVWQIALVFFGLTDVPAVPNFIIHFPVFRRFTYESFAYALSRALIYILTSFGLVYLCQEFGNGGIWILMAPICIGFHWGLIHFEKLEGVRWGHYQISQEHSH